MAKKLGYKIYFDDKSGEVCTVECTKRLAAEGPLFKLDVLKDTLAALEAIYNMELENFYCENTKLARA